MTTSKKAEINKASQTNSIDKLQSEKTEFPSEFLRKININQPYLLEKMDAYS